MSAQVQFTRETKAVNDAYIGPVGQVTIDTDTRSLRLHDGVNAGGFRVAGQVRVSRVTTGTSFTLTIKAAEELIVWASATSGGKTTNIPAAAPTIDGCKIIVAATLSNGDHHSIVPPSGTINNASSFLFDDDPGTVTMVCDGAGTNWIIT